MLGIGTWNEADQTTEGMDDAVRMVKDGFKGIRQGVYLVRGAGKAGMKKVTVFEK